jgi:hypothetical protein
MMENPDIKRSAEIRNDKVKKMKETSGRKAKIGEGRKGGGGKIRKMRDRREYADLGTVI